MNKVLLCVIEDVFDISDRGIILAPGFPVAEYTFDREYDVEIEPPGGKGKQAKARFVVPLQSPPPQVVSYYCHLSGIEKADIPVGSKLWLLNVDEQPLGSAL
jgi:hypothetical protein